jgi:hypothetical protein
MHAAHNAPDFCKLSPCRPPVQALVCNTSNSSTNCELCSRRHFDDPRSVCISSPQFIFIECYHVTVHALYNRNRRIAILLFSLLISQVLTMILCVTFTVNNLDFDALCLPANVPRLYLPLACVRPHSPVQPTLTRTTSQHRNHGNASYHSRPRLLSVHRHDAS